MTEFAHQLQSVFARKRWEYQIVVKKKISTLKKKALLCFSDSVFYWFAIDHRQEAEKLDYIRKFFETNTTFFKFLLPKMCVCFGKCMKT